MKVFAIIALAMFVSTHSFANEAAAPAQPAAGAAAAETKAPAPAAEAKTEKPAKKKKHGKKN